MTVATHPVTEKERTLEERLRRSQIFIARAEKTGPAPEERHLIENHLLFYVAPSGAGAFYVDHRYKDFAPTELCMASPA